jgi:hypothetical protein
MSAGVVLAAAALVAAVVVVVAWPFVSTRPEPPEAQLTPAQRRRLELVEQRDAAYAGLRDLEQDRRTGKVSAEDYELERRRLRAEAGAALRALDRLGTIPGEAPEPLPPADWRIDGRTDATLLDDLQGEGQQGARPG